jgi:hypothetical protein
MTLFGSRHWQRSIRCQCCCNRTIVGLLPTGEFLRASPCRLRLRRAACATRLRAGECEQEQTALAAVECGRWENFFQEVSSYGRAGI